MANVNIEVQARTDQALRNLNNLTKGAGGMMAAFKDDAAGALGVFGVSLTALNQPLTLVADTLKQSVTAAANWGDEMGDLAAMTGQTVEETSEMAATFELVGIKGGTLNKVLKSLADDGINLNMRSLKELSAQYQQLKDPVEKNRFLFEHFGKSAADMAEIMGRSSEELDRLTLAAKNSGKVIGGEAADAAEEFNVNLAILQQKAEGAQIALGNVLIPTLNDAFTGLDNLVKGYGAVAITIGLATGAITQNEAATRAAALANGDLAAGFDYTKSYSIELANETEKLREENRLLGDQSVTTADAFDTFGLAAYGAATASFSLAVKEQDAAKAAQDLKQAESDLATAIAGPIGKENENYIQQQADIRLKMQDVQGEIDKLNTKKYLTPEQQTELNGLKTTLGDLQVETENNATAHEEATARIVFGFLQQRMAADGLQDGEITALAKIGRAWGIYDEDTARALEAVDKSITEHGTNAAAIIGDVEKAIEGLPDTKEIVIQVRTNGAQIGDENFGGWTATAGAAKSSGGGDTEINGMRAMGGPVMAGGAYIVGEQGPELFVPRQSGTVIANGGGSDEALRAALMSLPASIARAVRDGMQMAAA